MRAVWIVYCCYASPSLRGSGLKSSIRFWKRHPRHVSLFTREWIEIAPLLSACKSYLCLPLYEGVDWNMYMFVQVAYWHQSPSLRGSGLKLFVNPFFQKNILSPSLRGSGLKFYQQWYHAVCDVVSLFTREWIEIILVKIHKINILCLPLYEGVDWNCFSVCVFGCCIGLPLYEGVDWNVSQLDVQKEKKSPSLRGSGLKLSRTA